MAAMRFHLRLFEPFQARRNHHSEKPLSPPLGTCMSDEAERLFERLLVLRCQTGDEDAYRELVGRFGPRLRYYLRKLVGQVDRADDLAQEVWIDVLRQLPRLKDSSAFTTWIYRIAHGKAMLEGRRNGRVPTTTSDVEWIAEKEDDTFSA